MGKLSHIEDIEARQALEQAQSESAAAEPNTADEPAAVEPATAEASPAEPATPEGQSNAQTKHKRPRSSAELEEDFHGISTVESFGFGHTALLVLAVIVFIAAALYVLNYWFHFI